MQRSGWKTNGILSIPERNLMGLTGARTDRIKSEYIRKKPQKGNGKGKGRGENEKRSVLQ